tara:strand:- start:1036 stop:1377 length:342 start_codon:yes stop_codon:yes gene_type:complete
VAEIIEVPVENNPSVSEYTPKQVGGIIAGAVFGLLFFVCLVRGNTQIRENRRIQEKKWAEERENDPKRNTRDWQQHQRRLNKFGESKYQDTHFYVGPKGGVYYITYRGTKVYC